LLKRKIQLLIVLGKQVSVITPVLAVTRRRKFLRGWLSILPTDYLQMGRGDPVI